MTEESKLWDEYIRTGVMPAAVEKEVCSKTNLPSSLWPAIEAEIKHYYADWWLPFRYIDLYNSMHLPTEQRAAFCMALHILKAPFVADETSVKEMMGTKSHITCFRMKASGY